MISGAIAKPDTTRIIEGNTQTFGTINKEQF